MLVMLCSNGVVHLSDHNRVMVAQVDYYNFDLAMAIHSSKSFEMPLLLLGRPKPSHFIPLLLYNNTTGYH